MQGFGLIVRFVLRPGHAPAFDRLVAETLTGIRAHEPGTLIYATHHPADEPDGEVRIFFELYRDRAAFEEHERQPHVMRFLAARDEHVESTAVDFLGLIEGKGTDVRPAQP